MSSRCSTICATSTPDPARRSANAPTRLRGAEVLRGRYGPRAPGRLAAIVVALWAGVAQADRVFFSASDTQARLVELYTSEGCSSCPPADTWLARFQHHPDLFSGVVPVAFHVDYWDDLGWPDRFAEPDYSARQRRLARDGRSSGVYTPGVFVNGREWRGHFAGKDLPEPLPGVVPASIRGRLAGTTLEVRVAGPGATRHAILHAAVLGADLSTRVSRGENGGRTLDHTFVVLEHAKTAIDDGAARLELAGVDGHGAGRVALVLWVTDAAGDYLQATGTWLTSAEAAAVTAAAE